MKLLFILFCLLSMTSCSTIHTQKGINLDDEGSYVTISTDTEKNNSIFVGLDKRVVITSLDGENLFRIGWGYTYPDIIHVSPGIHTIGVMFTYLNSYAKGCIWLDAKLGQNYIIRRDVNGYTVRFWAENINAGEKVGGICGSQPNEM